MKQFKHLLSISSKTALVLLMLTINSKAPADTIEDQCLQGAHEQRVISCRKLIQSSNKSHRHYKDFYRSLGDSLDKLNRYKESVFIYQQALTLYPQDTYFLQHLSISQSNLKEQSWLQNRNTKTTANPPDASSDSVQLKLNKLKCQRFSGKKALTACNNALKLSTNDPELYGAKGDILAKLGRHSEASKAYKKALKLKPDDIIIKNKLAKLRVKKAVRTKVTKPVVKTTAKTRTSTTPAKNTPLKKQEADNPLTLSAEQRRFLQQLNLLKSLRSQELISEAEYNQRKQALLDENFRVKNKKNLADKKKPDITPKPKPFANFNIGQYYALVIGNNNYQKLKPLKTAVNDAQSLADLLQKQYGFSVRILLDANRYKILKALGELRRQMTKDDNLLIYYAGHGFLDKASERGYWLPIDADIDFTSNWISTSEITDSLKALQSKHVLVIADSCYSGTLLRNADIRTTNMEKPPALIKRLFSKKSRTVITSGGLEPVTDSGGNNHSVFAQALLDVLTQNNSVIESERVFSKLRDRVILNADQTPEYSNIRKVGHSGGDFIFVKNYGP